MLVVRKSGIDGKGVFAARALPARRKIGEYAGEQISRREGRRRARGRTVVAIVELGDGTALDGLVGGNEFRYINHSCSPNTYMRICADRAEFYALRAIEAGEELTCSYRNPFSGGRRCTCGSPSCRGTL